ncbi:MAG: M48 family metallopeptidase [Kiloniellales bacterium]|nr:M48 family metallopeptidase [Kiloniellales bacterium]
MRIRNVPVPEGINVSRHSPLADLLILSGGLVTVVAGLGLALFLFAGVIARHAPVSWEVAIGNAIFADVSGGSAEAADADPEAAAVRAELQAIADRVGRHMDLPEGLTVKVHYVDDEMVNAFASLGGHVFMFRGLLERMPNENALTMVMAHEIGHVVHRDAAASLTGAVVVQLLSAVFFSAAPDTLASLVTGPNALMMMGFSREAERRADSAALEAMAAVYGHVGESARIFKVFQEEARRSGGEPPELLSTHPLSRERIEALAALARQRGWPSEGETQPLAPGIAALSEVTPEAK